MNNVFNKARAALIEARTREEQKIEIFAKSVNSVDREEVFGDTYIPPEISLRALCPEAYADDPDIETYNKQFEEMKKIFDAMNQKIIAYTQEALECQNQFKQLQ